MRPRDHRREASDLGGSLDLRKRRHGADGELAVAAARLRDANARCASGSLRRLTSRVGRKTPAFIISISAVPPAIGRTDGSSGSSSAIASSQRRRLGKFERRHGALPGCARECRAHAARRTASPSPSPSSAAPAGRGCRAFRSAPRRSRKLILVPSTVLRQPRERRRGQPADDAERRAFDLGLDLLWRIDAHHLDRRH